MKRFILLLVLLAGFAVTNVAQDARSSSDPEELVISINCPSGEPEQIRPETKLSLGDVTKKTRVLPKPIYPRGTKIRRVSRIVRANVVIDVHTGKVVWARIDNGHPLLRKALKTVVCRVEFYPTLIETSRFLVDGVITYRFGKR